MDSRWRSGVPLLCAYRASRFGGYELVTFEPAALLTRISMEYSVRPEGKKRSIDCHETSARYLPFDSRRGSVDLRQHVQLLSAAGRCRMAGDASRFRAGELGLLLRHERGNVLRSCLLPDPRQERELSGHAGSLQLPVGAAGILERGGRFDPSTSGQRRDPR